MLLALLLACTPSKPPQPVAAPDPVVVLPDPVTGPLAGWVLAVSPGHGKLLHRFDDGITPHSWDKQRDHMNGMREDDWTLQFVDGFLAPALERRGATVLSLRERDPSEGIEVTPLRVVGALDEVVGRAGQTALRVDSDGHAVWKLPRAGRVYVRWVQAEDQGIAHYVLDGQRADVDQRRAGGVWWPLGTITEPTELWMHGAGDVLSAGEVRIGGGEFHAEFPELEIDERLPFTEVAAVHSLPLLGGPDSLLMLDNGEFISDMRFRARWSSWALEGLPKTAFLSIHSNAGGGAGTSVFVGIDSDVDPPLPAHPGGRVLRDAVLDAMADRLPALEPKWNFNPDVEGNFSEISPFWNTLDGALIEVGHHDSAFDAKRLLNTEFQEAAADAIASGVERYAEGQ